MTKIHKSWLVLIALCGLAAASIGISINTSGVFYSVVSEDLGIFRGAFAFNMTIFSLVNAIAGLFVVRLFDRFPFKLVLTASVILATLSTGLMGNSSQLWQFYLLGALRGISTGMFSIMTLTLIINYWFSEKNGLATSIALSFSGITGAMMSPIFAKIIVANGWHFAYWIQALALFLFCVPALVLPFQDNPLKEGRSPYGHKEVISDAGPVTSHFKVNSAYIAMIIFAVSLAFISSMVQHFPGFAESIKLDVTTGAALLSMAMIGNIVFKLIVGFLSDLLGPIKACLVLVSANLIAVLIFLISSKPVMLMPAALLFGAIFGVLAVSIPLITRQLFGLDNYGKAYPIINFATNTGAALAFSAIGFIYDFANSYYPALILFLILLALAMVSLVYASKKA